jgi:hypothetical protein
MPFERTQFKVERFSTPGENFPPIRWANHQLPTKTGHSDGVFQRFSRVRSTESSEVMERAMGIEPTSEAWEASILPLYDARSLLTILFQSSVICTED